MKNTFPYKAIFVLAILLVSCSEDDDTGNSEDVTNYFPLEVGNSWDYNNTFIATGQEDFFGSETLSVANTLQQYGNQVFEMETSNPENSGLSTLILSQGILFKNNSRLIYTGEFSLGIPDFNDIAFDLENVPIYDTQVSPGTQLFEESTSLQEQLQGLPITLNFNIITNMGNNLNTLEVNGVTYTDVISSEWIINLEVLAGSSIFSTPILENQEVSRVINYFAKDIGLIKSESTSTLVFEEFEFIPLEDIDSSSLQELTNYSVNSE